MKQGKVLATTFVVALMCCPFLQQCAPGTMDDDKQTGHELSSRKGVRHVVQIAQMKFTPNELVAKPGDTVVFLNHDMVTHDITESSTKSWHSSKLDPGKQWYLPVTTSAEYFCSLHPVMKGRIVVE